MVVDPFTHRAGRQRRSDEVPPRSSSRPSVAAAGTTTSATAGRKLLLMAAQRVDDTSWARIHAALCAGDRDRRVAGRMVGKEYVRAMDAFLTNDSAVVRARVRMVLRVGG